LRTPSSGRLSRATDKYTLHAPGKSTISWLTYLFTLHRHTVCINNNVIYLFGGADLEQRTNELYSFDPCKLEPIQKNTHVDEKNVFFFSYQQLETDQCTKHSAAERLTSTSLGCSQSILREQYLFLRWLHTERWHILQRPHRVQDDLKQVGKSQSAERSLAEDRPLLRQVLQLILRVRRPGRDSHLFRYALLPNRHE
jgi:hypothetical protein